MAASAQSESARDSGGPTGSPIDSIITAAKTVITNPTQFYTGLPKSGGFVEPLTFVAAMAFASALVGVVLSIFGLGFAPTIGGALVSVILMPLFATIFGFVGAAVLFGVWRLLGSRESYETAYRCAAYMMAISPLTTLINVIPYLGVLVALGWSLYLVLVASERVHGIPPQTARVAFGLFFALLAVVSITSQIASRRLQVQVESWNEQMENMEEMTPEEAGKAVGEFLEGLEKSMKPEKDEAE
jgi:hypothetical protein